MVFSTEKEMVETIENSNFIKKVMRPGPSIIEKEVDGFFGIPDIVIIKKTDKKHVSYAYEAKLSNWSRAVIQAFHYKAFVNRSYVILDDDKIGPAISHIDRFSAANVGLLSIENSGQMHIHYNPHNESPYSPQLAEKFNNKIANAVYNF